MFEEIQPLLEEAQEIDFRSVKIESYIDVTKEVKRQPVALSIGSYMYKGYQYPIPFGSYGDFSCLVGASKSMKTFLKSALLAGYIGGRAQNHFSDFKGHETHDKYVLDIDTEQSEYHAHRAAKRVLEMVGFEYGMYKPFALRKYDPKTRLEFLEWLVYESEYAGKIGFMAVDGAADLLDNVNDLEGSNKVAQKFLKWTKEGNFHLLTVLHRNHGTMKPTGHLGSAILKKAETVAFVERDGYETLVKPEYTRNIPFNQFSFELDENYLPREREKQGII